MLGYATLHISVSLDYAMLCCTTPRHRLQYPLDYHLAYTVFHRKFQGLSDEGPLSYSCSESFKASTRRDPFLHMCSKSCESYSWGSLYLGGSRNSQRVLFCAALLFPLALGLKPGGVSGPVWAGCGSTVGLHHLGTIYIYIYIYMYVCIYIYIYMR